MHDHRKLISWIREFIIRGANSVTPEVEDAAVKLAAFVEEIQKRIVKCIFLLNENRREAALDELQEEPHLLGLIGCLNYTEIDKFINFCKEQRLPYPPSLNEHQISRLQNAWSKRDFLQPLLKQFESSLHQSEPEHKISLLLKIKELDADNPKWVDLLRDLQSVRMAELQEQAELALRTRDLRTILQINEEITDPRNVVPAPENLINQLSDYLSEAREKQAYDEGMRISSLLDLAVRQKDEERARKLLFKWKNLLEEDTFKPEENILRTAQAAKQWVCSINEERKKNKDYQAALANAWQTLDKDKIVPEDVRKAWRNVLSFKRDVPDALKITVTETLNDIDAEIRQEKLVRFLALVGAVFFLASVIGFAGWRYHILQVQKNAQKDLVELIGNKDWNSAAHYLRNLKAANPKVYETQLIQQLKELVETSYKKPESGKKEQPAPETAITNEQEQENSISQ